MYHKLLMALCVCVLGGCVQQNPRPTTIALAPTGVSPTFTVAATQTNVSNASSTPVIAASINAQQRQILFDHVLLTLKTHYLLGTDVDWEQLKREYEPQIQAASSDDHVYQILKAMTQRLNNPNTVFFAPTEAQEQDVFSAVDAGYVGIGVLTPDQKTNIIAQVFPDSPAAEAGLQRGDRIIAVDGEPFTDFKQLRGVVGNNVTLTIRSSLDQSRDITLTRRTINQNIRPISQRLPNNPTIGYLLIPMISPTMDTLVAQELETLSADGNLDGLIIDLRLSSGDSREAGKNILGNFTKGHIGAYKGKYTTNAAFISANKNYDTFHAMALVVLIDKVTQWDAEIVAGVLQLQGVTVIGTASRGDSDSVFIYNFDDGSRLWVVQERITLLDGTTFQGKGVQPTIVIDDDWTKNDLNNDPVIVKAVEVIQQK